MLSHIVGGAAANICPCGDEAADFCSQPRLRRRPQLHIRNGKQPNNYAQVGGSAVAARPQRGGLTCSFISDAANSVGNAVAMPAVQCGDCG